MEKKDILFKSFQIIVLNLTMNTLCKVSDRSIIENESEYKDYPATMRKKNEKSLYNK